MNTDFHTYTRWRAVLASSLFSSSELRQLSKGGRERFSSAAARSGCFQRNRSLISSKGEKAGVRSRSSSDAAQSCVFQRTDVMSGKFGEPFGQISSFG